MSLKIARSKEETSSEELPVDEFCHNELFDVLGNRRRRYVLCYLLRENGPVECRKIAIQIAAWENDSEPEQVGTSQYQSVYNSLYQSHFPKLESVGLLKYDRSENLVYPTNKMPEIELFVDSVAPTFKNGIAGRLPAMMTGLLIGCVVAVLFVLSSSVTLPVTIGILLLSFGAILAGGLAG